MITGLVIPRRKVHVDDLIIDDDINLGTHNLTGTGRITAGTLEAGTKVTTPLVDSPTGEALSLECYDGTSITLAADNVDCGDTSVTCNSIMANGSLLEIDQASLLRGLSFTPAGGTTAIATGYKPEQSTKSTTNVKASPHWLVTRSGKVRVEAQLKRDGAHAACMEIWKNGAITGSALYTSSTDYETKGATVSVDAGDYLTVYFRSEAGTTTTVYIKDIFIKTYDPYPGFITTMEKT